MRSSSAESASLGMGSVLMGGVGRVATGVAEGVAIPEMAGT